MFEKIKNLFRQDQRAKEQAEFERGYAYAICEYKFKRSDIEKLEVRADSIDRQAFDRGIDEAIRDLIRIERWKSMEACAVVGVDFSSREDETHFAVNTPDGVAWVTSNAEGEIQQNADGQREVVNSKPGLFYLEDPTPDKQEPPLDNLPIWAEWIAQDFDGQWYAYGDEPYADTKEGFLFWQAPSHKGLKYLTEVGDYPQNPNWQQTKRKIK